MSEEYELPRDCDFSKAGVNDSTPSECTPQLSDGILTKYEGIIINAPEYVVWPRDFDTTGMMVSPQGEIIESPMKCVVAGVARLPFDTLGLYGVFGYDVVVVAINRDTAETYSGKMVRLGVPTEPTLYAHRDPETPRTSYFNVDLVHNLGVPVEDATYIVYATLGHYKSNVLTVQIKVE